MKRRPGPNTPVRRWRQALSSAPDNPAGESAELKWARTLLQGGRDYPPGAIDPSLAGALVDALVTRAEVGALGWLAELDQRKLAKAARAGLHRLRARGVQVDLPRVRAASANTAGETTRRGELTICEGTVTPYDWQANRIVWVAQPAPGGVSWLRAIVSARSGLVELFADLVSRRSYRHALKELRGFTTPVRVDAPTARWFIHEAAQRTTAAGRALPDEAVRALRELGAVAPGEHPALTIEQTNQSTDALLELYELPELSHWVPDEQALRQITLRCAEVQTSRLLIDDGQRSEQTAHALQRGVDDYFSDEAHLASARRVLLDTAQLIRATGRSETAARLRAAAALFDEFREHLPSHPFVSRFITRWVESSPGAAAGPEGSHEASDDDLILVP